MPPAACASLLGQSREWFAPESADELVRFLHRMFFGHRRSFDGDERAVRRRAERVNQLSEQRLAGPRLADDQDRGSGRRDRDGEIDHLAPARIVADQAELAGVLVDTLWWNEADGSVATTAGGSAAALEFDEFAGCGRIAAGAVSGDWAGVTGDLGGAAAGAGGLAASAVRASQRSSACKTAARSSAAGTGYLSTAIAPIRRASLARSG